MWRDYVSILQDIIFDIALPTADVFGDINFALRALSTGHFGIGFLMTLPVFINFILICFKWKTTDLDTPKEKKFTWLLVFMNVWPQYQIAKLIAIKLKKY